MEVWCFIICFSYAKPVASVTDSFCQSYKQTVLTRDEVAEVMKLSTSIRLRLQGNELEYLCRCKQAKIKACENYNG